MNRTKWVNRIALLLVWIVVTAGVSFYVARNAVPEENQIDVTEPLPQVGLEQRATVSLAETTIVPIVSASGTVVRYNDAWLLEAPANSDDVAYRLLDPPVAVRAQINGGPSGFTCPWVGLGQSGVVSLVPMGEEDVREVQDATPETIQPVNSSGVAADVTMRCEIPDDVRVAAGMSGLMVLQMDQPNDAQALPVTAVVGSAEQGQVVVVHEDGTTEVRTVQLGVSDIYNLEITDGLQPDEVVLQTPTESDFVRVEEGA